MYPGKQSYIVYTYIIYKDFLVILILQYIKNLKISYI